MLHRGGALRLSFPRSMQQSLNATEQGPLHVSHPFLKFPPRQRRGERTETASLTAESWAEVWTERVRDGSPEDRRERVMDATVGE